MEVKKGYKQTEVGVIPEGWELWSAGDLCERIMVGIVIQPSQYYVAQGVPAFRSANIHENKITTTDLVFISQISNEMLSKSKAVAGDILTVRTGYPGKSAVVNAEHAGCNCIDILISRPSRRVNSLFLSTWINSSFGKEQVLRNQGGLAQKHFNVGDMKQLIVALPSLAEQEAIAGALSDADAWIESLEQLIAKKRQIKQGAMQELLTGKSRLPGFTGKWETKRLGEHLTFFRNGTNSRAELNPDGFVKYLHYGDVHACPTPHLHPDHLPSLPAEKAKHLDRLLDGDLVFVDASKDLVGVSKSVEIVGTGHTQVVSGLHTIAVRFDKNIVADGFKAFLQFCFPVASHLRRHAAGTKVLATNRKHIASIEIRLPCTIEQTAIASVLSDMDAEIASLEAKLAKARQIKQGMMQELLTGRIRLV